MKNKRKNIIISLLPLFLIPLVFLAAYIYQHYIRVFVLPCPFVTIFNAYCPGCGGTRCIYALLSGDVLLALRSNALYFAGFVFCGLFWLENILASFGKGIKIIPRSSSKFIVAASGIAILYIILRNFIPIIAPV